jgi:hypothetical protein
MKRFGTAIQMLRRLILVIVFTFTQIPETVLPLLQRTPLYLFTHVFSVLHLIIACDHIIVNHWYLSDHHTIDITLFITRSEYHRINRHVDAINIVIV